MELSKLRGMGIIADKVILQASFEHIKQMLGLDKHPKLQNVKGDIWAGTYQHELYFIYQAWEEYVCRRYEAKIFMDTNDFSTIPVTKDMGIYTSWDDLLGFVPVKKIKWQPLTVEIERDTK